MTEHERRQRDVSASMLRQVLDHTLPMAERGSLARTLAARTKCGAPPTSPDYSDIVAALFALHSAATWDLPLTPAAREEHLQDSAACLYCIALCLAYTGAR